MIEYVCTAAMLMECWPRFGSGNQGCSKAHPIKLTAEVFQTIFKVPNTIRFRSPFHRNTSWYAEVLCPAVDVSDHNLANHFKLLFIFCAAGNNQSNVIPEGLVFKYGRADASPPCPVRYFPKHKDNHIKQLITNFHVTVREAVALIGEV